MVIEQEIYTNILKLFTLKKANSDHVHERSHSKHQNDWSEALMPLKYNKITVKKESAFT